MNVQSILAAKGDAVATVATTQSLGEAVEALRAHGVGALVVSDDGSHIDGILSERDVVRSIASQGRDCLDTHIAAAMSSEVITCQPADTIERLMAMMTERRIRHLPVANADGELAGIVSIGDVVKFRLIELEQENSQLHDYIEGRA